MLTEFRVNSYQTFQTPPKPEIEVRTNQSGLLPRKRRAEILRAFLKEQEPNKEHCLEIIQRSAD
jgi:hypothetical protein